MTTQEWLQLELLLHSDQAEALGGLLFDLGALGVEEHPLFDNPSDAPTWTRAHIHTQRHSPATTTRLVVYLPLDLTKDEQQHITEVAMQFGAQHESIIWSKLRDDGWSTRWQAFFQPLPIGETLLICPSWETPPQDNQRHVIWLDPGMAFGTGHHATTRSCLVLLEQYIQQQTTPPPILDIGCGSGILSMAAVYLGAPHAYGVDIDADAIQIAKENAEHNQLQAQCHFDTTPIEQIQDTYSLIVANIQAHILTPMAPHILARLQPHGALLLSGIWHEFADDLILTFQQFGLQMIQQIADDDWITVLFQQSTPAT